MVAALTGGWWRRWREDAVAGVWTWDATDGIQRRGGQKREEPIRQRQEGIVMRGCVACSAWCWATHL
eukprot:354519-Chlamydomonas_euryale.AAC.9